MNGWRTLYPNAMYIAIREYKSRVGGKSFVIGTVFLAVLAFAATQLPILIDYVSGTSQTKVEVLVRTSDLPADAQVTLDSMLNGEPSADPNAHKGWLLTWKTSAPGASGADQVAAEAAVEKGEFGAVLIIDRNATTKELVFTLRADWPSDGREATYVKNAVGTLAVEDRLARAGVSLGKIVAPADFKVTAIKGAAGSDGTNSKSKNTSQEVSSILFSTVLVVLIFMAIITYGTWVAMSVAEEKGSRVMELMLNATTPLQMLAGKVIGNGAAGLTQYGIIIGSTGAGLMAQGPIKQAVMGSSADTSSLNGLSLPILGAFLVLFLFGFLLYSLLYAALGSLVSRQEDIQSATSPLMMIIMCGYFVASLGKDVVGDQGMAIMSQVPFFSPYVMLRRVAEGTVAPWEFALCLVLLLAASAVALVVAARIYSAGVLLYGQRVGLRQVLKAARVSR